MCTTPKEDESAEGWMLASSSPYMFDTLLTGMNRPAILTFAAFSAILLAAIRPIKSMLMFTSAQTYRTN